MGEILPHESELQILDTNFVSLAMPLATLLPENQKRVLDNWRVTIENILLALPSVT